MTYIAIGILIFIVLFVGWFCVGLKLLLDEIDR